jgi:hypothetical protein
MNECLIHLTPPDSTPLRVSCAPQGLGDIHQISRLGRVRLS